MLTHFIKQYIVGFIICLSLLACSKNDDETIAPPKYDINTEYNLNDISYGSDAKQTFNLYLPKNRNKTSTKVFVMIHGGSWSEGDKADLNSYAAVLKNTLPQYAIANINYRLGNASAPGHTKQLEDIKQLLNHLQKEDYQIGNQYFLIGVSAGAHLAMLYGYSQNANQLIKGIANIVGPSDFTDPSYRTNLLFLQAITGLVGNVSYDQNPNLYASLSPINHVSASSPKTISFYGEDDWLIPISQKARLDAKLNEFNVINESYLYSGEGHGNWHQNTTNHFITKLLAFINTHF